MDEFDILMAVFLILIIANAVILGMLLKGSIQVEAREDGKKYIRVNWEQD